MTNSDWGIARLRPSGRYGFVNAGWTLDAYPELDTLNAGHAMKVAELEGPGVIHRLHITQHALPPAILESHRLTAADARALVSRGVVFEVYYNGCKTPSVRVPLGDFFLDGCGGRGGHYSTIYLEAGTESYNCFIPMPFKNGIRIQLVNETEFDLLNYTYVEWERLPVWEEDLGYFHATWKREAFQLTSATDRPFFHVEGAGHLLGRTLSIATDEPIFGEFCFVMEGNNEYRVDGEAEPRVDILGTECVFGMCWGWPERFIGLRNGTTFVQHKEPALLSTYTFRKENVLPFEKSLDIRIDWSHEFPGNDAFHAGLAERNAAGGGWVDYADGYYWYQRDVGYEHSPMASAPERAVTVLHPNPT